MNLSDFDYHLPKELIAQYPLKERDASRLLVLDRKNRSILHKNFSQILEYFHPADLLVLNNTKVLPARVFGRRKETGARIEFLLTQRDGDYFSVMIKPAKKFKIGEKIIFGENNGSISAKIVDKNKIAFESGESNEVYKLGIMPLPPYIKRKSEELDFKRYQTVFAEKNGSIAAPTAGLHFTKGLLTKIKDRGVQSVYVTLHVGTGTFKPVKVEDVAKHKMDPEYFEISGETEEIIAQAKKNGGRIFAVGSTSCRVIETIADLPTGRSPQPAAHSGFTNLFIYPGYQFKVVNCLLTNFHLPKSTLFMLVCAFCDADASLPVPACPVGRRQAGASGSAGSGAGTELVKRAYQEAIEKKYRFYSYGDAMLII